MITTAQMKELENNAVQRGISKLQLMEAAGRGVFNVLSGKFDLPNKNVLIVCYHGNNGGDGFVAARYLCDICEVDVLFLGDEDKLKDDANANYKRIMHNEKIQFLSLEDVSFDDYDVIIDAILGVGIQGALKPELINALEQMNSSRAFKVAVDIPTGLNPDTGEQLEKVFNADLIITFHDIKPGLESLKERIDVVDIGLR